MSLPGQLSRRVQHGHVVDGDLSFDGFVGVRELETNSEQLTPAESEWSAVLDDRGDHVNCTEPHSYTRTERRERRALLRALSGHDQRISPRALPNQGLDVVGHDPVEAQGEPTAG